MSTRVRWFVFGGALFVLLGMVALSMLNSNPRMFSERDDGIRHVWIVRQGHMRTWQADDVSSDDTYRCPGHPAIHYTPEPGTGYTEGGGLSVSTAEDGTVTARCGSGPATTG